MNHKNFQKYFISYLDGELTEVKHDRIDAHLHECELCRKLFIQMQKIYYNTRYINNVKKEAISPYLWTRFQARLQEHRKEGVLAWSWRLMKKLQPIVTVMLMLAAILGGYYLGNIQEPETVIVAPSSEQLLQQAFFTDAFNPHPPQSLGQALMMINASPSEVLP